jgi:cobyrinic acid a,c-diamide synthase
MTARIVIAGAHSGVGKTTLATGLMAAFVQRGLRVQGFKVGPDYIDPTYHALATGRPGHNLDTWMVPPERVRESFAHAASQVDIAIVEGVMGLYDGLGYEDETGSTAQVAKLLGAPTLLVLDAGGMARSAGALALGYRQFDTALPLAGFIVNRVGGELHGAGVARAIQAATGLPVLGWLTREAALDIPERHLGLIPTMEPGRWRAFVEAAAAQVARHLDLDAILSLARNAPPMSPIESCFSIAPGIEHRPIIAVARDEAFSFIYEDNLDLLRDAGAHIVFFSPLRDQALPPGAGGVILSGGFPEIYAARLAVNRNMLEALRAAHARGLPIYAECGGLMYLTQAIVDLDGQAHSMAGLLPGRSVMSGRLTLGYREARAAGDSWLFSAGESVRGHEFHYSAWEGYISKAPPAFYLQPSSSRDSDARPEGVCMGNLWASYVHLHFGGKPELAERFVRACRC